MTTDTDVILVGGPSDGTTVGSPDSPLLEFEADGLIHRYVRTTATRQHGGTTLTVYNYDGGVAPDGGRSGVESAPDRVASPLASDTTAPGTAD